MRAHTGRLQYVAHDPMLQGRRVENGFKVTRRVRSFQLSQLCVDQAASIEEAGGKVFLDRTGQRYSGAVALADARVVRRSLDRQKRHDDWRVFKETPLKSYLGRVAQLVVEKSYPDTISAKGGSFFTEVIGSRTFISCGITGWPSEPDFPVQQLSLERAATLETAEQLHDLTLLDNEHTTLKIAAFPRKIAAATIDPIVNDLNTAAEGVNTAIHLRSLLYVAYLDV